MMIGRPNAKRGYLYIACGERYVNEACISAKQLRRVDLNAHITIVTNCKIHESQLFDRIVFRETSSNSWLDGLLYRVSHISSSYYEKTFYIDTDVYFLESCQELFDLLDYCDLLMMPAPADKCSPEIKGKILNGLYPYNAGVIVFRRCATNRALFKNWYTIYSQKINSNILRSKENDQTALMEALIKSSAKVYPLANIYNARITQYLGIHYGAVKILHGRCERWEDVQHEINKNIEARGWDPAKRKIII